MGKQKILWLEALRIVCTIWVLIDHIPIGAIHLYDKTSSDVDRFICNGIVHVSHFAVPVFVMITGYLLLQPGREIGFRKALTKYAWRMIVVIAVMGTVFAWLELYFSDKHVTLYQLLTAFMNMLQGKSWNHMWYLYMLVGLYLMVPVLKSAIKWLPSWEINCFLIVVFAFTSVFPLVEHFTGFEFGVKFPISSVYVGYLLMGYQIGQMERKKQPKYRVYVMSVVLLMPILLFAFAYLEYVCGYMKMTRLSAYYSPLIVIFSGSIFYMFMTSTRDYSILMKWGGQFVSRDSFGIYVFHMIWINVIYKMLHFNPIAEGYWTMIPMLVIVLLLSCITTVIFRKIPWVGKFL